VSPARIRYVVARHDAVVVEDLPKLKKIASTADYKAVCEFITALSEDPRSKEGPAMRDEWAGYVNAHVAEKYRVIWTYEAPIVDGNDWEIPVNVARVGLKFPDWNDRGQTIYNDPASIERQTATGQILFSIEVQAHLQDREIWHFSLDCAYFDTNDAWHLGPPEAGALCEHCEALYDSGSSQVLRLGE